MSQPEGQRGKTWCKCGHHRSKHAPTPRVSGTSCLEQSCRCTRFETAAPTTPPPEGQHPVAEIPRRWRQQGADYRVDRDTGCWTWLKSLGPTGYPRLFEAGARRTAHRWYYEQVHGPIELGKQIHHVCENKLCVNPGHMEVLTRVEHDLRHPGASKHLGVIFNRSEQNWWGRVKRGGQRVHLGRFPTEAACTAAVTAAGGYYESGTKP